jgi:hypothetical protein
LHQDRPPRSPSRLGVAEPLETIDDEVEPEVEFGRTLGVRRRDVLLRMLDDVGVFVGGDVAQKVLGQVEEFPLVSNGMLTSQRVNPLMWLSKA